jgi:uncharacterized protein with NAD-binding domain and iron-sulfur cluster
MTTIILGGGIAGLATAHDLRKYQYPGKIIIIEKNSIIGGQARSSYYGDYFTEYSWRVYGPNYDTLRRMMKEIPVDSKTSVHDYLVDIDNYILLNMKDQPLIIQYGLTALSSYMKKFSDIPIKEKWILVNKLLTLMISSKDRLDNEFSNIGWRDYIPKNKKLQEYLVDAVGPYLGVDIYNVSVTSVLEIIIYGMKNGGKLSVFDGPTNEVFFNNWQRHLINKDVEFILESTVTKINTDTKTITYKKNNGYHSITANNIVCALPPYALIHLIDAPWVKPLYQKTKQWMTSIQYYFKEKIMKSTANTAIHLVDSPWQLIIEPQGLLWDRKWFSGRKFQDILSVGICDSVKPGMLYKKPAPYCTREEIVKDAWYQIQQSKFFPSITPIKNVKYMCGHLWDQFQPNDKNILTTPEPKCGPGIGTLKLRPYAKTDINGFYFAGVHCRNPEEMMTMDLAAVSGSIVAKYITKLDTKQHNNKTTILSLFLWPLRYIDEIMYRNKYGHYKNSVVILCIYIIIILIVVYNVWKS